MICDASSLVSSREPMTVRPMTPLQKSRRASRSSIPRSRNMTISRLSCASVIDSAGGVVSAGVVSPGSGGSCPPAGSGAGAVTVAAERVVRVRRRLLPAGLGSAATSVPFGLVGSTGAASSISSVAARPPIASANTARASSAEARASSICRG